MASSFNDTYANAKRMPHHITALVVPSRPCFSLSVMQLLVMLAMNPWLSTCSCMLIAFHLHQALHCLEALACLSQAQLYLPIFLSMAPALATGECM